MRFVRLRPGQWEGPALFKLALLLLVEVYQLSGHRIAAEPGSKIVLVTPTRRVHAHFITALGLSNATTASINGGEARRAAFVGTTLRAFVETGLPDLPAPGHLRAADAQTLFEYLRDHQWELGAFIDLHTATVCAGSTGAVDILVVDTVGRFHTVRTLCKGLPQVPHAQRARCLSPLPPIAGGILAAMELHASLYGTMVSYEDLSRSYGLPSGVDLPPHQDHAIVQEFYDKWSVNLQPSHKDACAVLAWAACETAPPCQLLLRQPDKWVTDKKRQLGFFGDRFCLHFSVSIH